jgi:transposase
VRQAFEAAGVTYRYLPPYSPDFNPMALFAVVIGTVRCRLR